MAEESLKGILQSAEMAIMSLKVFELFVNATSLGCVVKSAQIEIGHLCLDVRFALQFVTKHTK